MKIALRRRSAFATVLLAAGLLGMAGGCSSGHADDGKRDRQPADARVSAEGNTTSQASGANPAVATGPLQAVDLNDPVRPTTIEGPVVLDAARNEWTSLTLQIDRQAKSDNLALRLPSPKSASGQFQMPAGAVEVWQVVPMPVDVNRAGYVRHTGLTGGQRKLPRALLPVPVDESGAVPLGRLRDPGPGNPLLLWIDLHVPADAPHGPYAAACELVDGKRVVAGSVPVQLTVYNFALPDERHLQIVGNLGWDALTRLYPDRFEAVRPRLFNRREHRYDAAIGTLDRLVALGQRHRASVVIPRLQPTVKWPANEPPQVDWTDFDSVVSPWLNGDAFAADRTPLGYWPLPAPEFLDTVDPNSQLQYWTRAARHFDQNNWLGRSSVWVDQAAPIPGRPGSGQAVELSAWAAQVLARHPRLRVTLPLETDQLQFAGDAQPGLLDPATAGRVWAAAPGLVFAPPMKALPAGADAPDLWLRTDVKGLIPYVGAGGDERDVRLWAWLAYLRQPNTQPTPDAPKPRQPRPMVVWGETLPSQANANEPADPNEMVWFYPGEWFGLDEPVPTIQLKWLRRAQQDFEYLWLAGERGQRLDAVMMARLITKPVEVQPGQSPDPAYALMSGTTDAIAWADAQRLLAAKILAHDPQRPASREQQFKLDNIDLKAWMEPQERPLLFARTSLWGIERQPDGSDWVFLRLGLDIYNASDTQPDQNLLQWATLPPGWKVKPQPVTVAPLATYRVRRESMDARFNPAKFNDVPAAGGGAAAPEARRPMGLTFTNGFTRNTQTVKAVVPVAACDRREGQLAIDGKLEPHEWAYLDALQDGPMVRMLSRPDLQHNTLHFAETPARVYSGWAEGNFYVAFELEGLSPLPTGAVQNFVNYQFGRAWGEDLCEILVQPTDEKGTAGPVLHVVCKPNGSSWVERKPGAKESWQAAEANIRYSARLEGGKWRGEVAIPWKAILAEAPDANRDGTAAKAPPPPRGGPADASPAPPLLRFNFAQHRSATGESASWCGPVDFGRDESLMGVLYLRDPEAARVARGAAGGHRNGG